MAITITPVTTTPGYAATRPPLTLSPRQRKRRTFKVAGDTSYPTGGYDIAVTFKGFQGSVADWGQAQDASGARLATVDIANKKLKLFTALGTEAANASNQSTITEIYVELVGY